jgi:catechol 2,3-dioxygenase-like lactoylglutathione lyase family enzyme
MDMEARLSLVTLGVADLKRSRAFYEKLGFRASSAGGGEVFFFQAGSCALAVFPRESLACDAGVPAEGAGFSGVALAHNVRQKEDVAKVLAEAAAAGGRIVKPAQDAPWGGHSGYFADPDGHLWEAAWNPFFPIEADGTLRLPP